MRNWLDAILSWFRSTTSTASADPVRHVILLMFENHSFDQMLGCFQSVFPNEVEGVDLANPRSNKDSSGREYFQRASSDPVVDPDPKHELAHILNQLKDGNAGFVSEYEKEYPDTTPDQRQRVMDYFGPDDLPALQTLARSFTVCDHWYASVPGPTWTNRFFAYSGTSQGIVDMPTSVHDTDLYLHYDQDTLFDRLNDRGVSWRVYFGDVPNSLVLRHQQHPRNALHYRLMHEFFADAQGPEPGFPSFALIEPNYMKGEQNDDHPPHSTMRAQRLLAHVYNALRKNGPLWNSTLLVVVYDENGGFYDHVSPPAAVPPDDHRDRYTFDRLGVRVPALLVSPWVGRSVVSDEFDHTSLLKYLTEKWGLAQLTARAQAARSFSAAVQTTGLPRTDTPEAIPVPGLLAQAMPPAMSAEETAAPLNENQKALLVFSEHLQAQTAVPAAPPVAMAGAAPHVGSEAAKRRVEAFLTQQKALAATTAGQV